MSLFLKILSPAFLFAVLLIPGAASFAAPGETPPAPVVDIIPAHSLQDGAVGKDLNIETHPPLRLTPDKSELLRIDRKASAIIVGNPAHVSVLADTAHTLVIVPRMPGATYFTVLDEKGEVIMARHVIVASPKEKYIRIRQSCAGAEKACEQTQVYFCPDMCHKISLVSGESEPPPAAAPSTEPPPPPTEEDTETGDALP
ncbi:MAG: pilus assembly protein N-terminal domain-containing protein [Alphaproteobacteria bacterium]|nr:pilus assembly protein N-terminal domain-containing protein [Alphaproteobacteria bacterium]